MIIYAYYDTTIVTKVIFKNLLLNKYFDHIELELSKNTREYIKLSTCLRFEVCANIKNENLESAIQILTKNKFVILTDQNVMIERIFGIAAGLYSEIIGEREILKQIQLTVDACTKGTKHRHIFEQGIKMAYSFRKENNFYAKHNYVSLMLNIIHTYPIKQNAGIMLLGSGMMATEFLKHILNDRHFDGCHFYLVNRNAQKYQQLVSLLDDKNIRYQIMNLDDMPNALDNTDLLLAAIRGNEDRAIPARLHHKLLIADISSPPVFRAISDDQYAHIRLVTMLSPLFKDQIRKANQLFLAGLSKQTVQKLAKHRELLLAFKLS